MVLQMIRKGIDSDEVFMATGADIGKLSPIIMSLASSGYLKIAKEPFNVSGFETEVQHYELTLAGEQKIGHVSATLSEKWKEMTFALADKNSGNLEKMVSDNEERIVVMVLLEVIDEHQAEEVLIAANRMNKGNQKSTDERWQRSVDDLIENYAGYHVQYD